MQQHHAQGRLLVKDGPLQQPLEQQVAVRRVQHLLQRVAAAQPGAAERDGEQVQVVVAERGDRGIAEGPYAAQDTE